MWLTGVHFFPRARGIRGGTLEVMLSELDQSVRIGKSLTLTTDWAQLTAVLPAKVVDAGRTVSLQVTGAHPGKHAAVVWLDDVVVTVNSTTTLQ